MVLWSVWRYKIHTIIFRNISTSRREILTVAEITNRVVLNFWSPGYTIKESTICADGKERLVKNFFSTSTMEAAISCLIKKYGSNNYLKFKEDIHPGHCSVHTKTGNYLSVGPNATLENIRINSQHEIMHIDNFETDVIGMGRFPNKRLDFYTLNIAKIDKLISSMNIFS